MYMFEDDTEILLKCLQFQEEITVLSLEHVKIAFTIYASGMCLTVFVFIMETVVGRIKSRSKARSKARSKSKLDKKMQAWVDAGFP